MRLLPAAFALSLLAGAALAHESWLRPAANLAMVGQPIGLDFTSGMAFPAPDTGPKPVRVGAVAAVIDGRPQPFQVVGPAPGVLEFVMTPERRGLAVVTVTLKPNDIVMASTDVAEYFDEADPTPDIVAAWRGEQASGEWRETYVKNAKALVCVEACARSRTAMTPTGQHLEFIARDPGPGPRRFRLLARGKPLPGATVRLFTPGAPARKLKTDAAGDVALPLDVSGEVMLSAIWLRPPTEPGGKFSSDFASIVFGR